MRPAAKFHLVLGNLLERKSRTLIAAGVIALAVAVVMFVASLALGFLSGVMQKAEEAFPPTLLTVKPNALNLSILTFNSNALGKKQADEIAAMDGVVYAAAQTPLKMPLHATGNIMGSEIATDAVVVGIGPEVLAKELSDPKVFSYDEATSFPVPCVLPRYFLDMYNLAYAESMGLPKINESFAIGKDFILHIGSSFLLGSPDSGKVQDIQIPCRIVGMTSNPSLFVGLLLPLGHALELNRLYGSGGEPQFNAIHVEVGDAREVAGITAKIREMGFIVESHLESLEKVQMAAQAATLLTGLFAALIVAIAAAGIFNTFSLIMAQRRGEVGLLRAVGGTRRDVTRLFVWEVAMLALLGGGAGAAVSAAVLTWADRRLLSILPKISFLPEHLFRVSPLLAIACILGAVALSVLATYPIIRRITATPPATLVSEA